MKSKIKRRNFLNTFLFSLGGLTPALALSEWLGGADSELFEKKICLIDKFIDQSGHHAKIKSMTKSYEQFSRSRGTTFNQKVSYQEIISRYRNFLAEHFTSDELEQLIQNKDSFAGEKLRRLMAHYRPLKIRKNTGFFVA